MYNRKLLQFICTNLSGQNWHK